MLMATFYFYRRRNAEAQSSAATAKYKHLKSTAVPISDECKLGVQRLSRTGQNIAFLAGEQFHKDTHGDLDGAFIQNRARTESQ